MTAPPIEAWPARLREKFGWPAEPVLTKFPHGQSNPTFLVELADRRLVLRKKPPGTLLPTAHDVEREFRVLTALARADYPAPRPIAYCPDADVIGTPFYMMGFVPGRAFRTLALDAGASADDRRTAMSALIETLARLHRIDIGSVGLADFGPPGGYFRRQSSRWTRQYRASETRRIDAVDWLIAWLAEHEPRSDRAVLIHGDYRIDNVVFADDAPRIVAVLDWELSTIGHPAADLAYAIMPLIMPASLDGVADRRVAGLPSVAACVDAYRRCGGESWHDDLAAFVVLALFRRAAILQGVLARALAGNASAANALERGALAEPVAELGRRVAEHGIPA